MTVAILTVSDSVAAGTREDVSGPAVRQRCEELGWNVVEHRVVPDEEGTIASTIRSWADDTSVSLILSTGGTGVSPRDVTPEATRSVIERELPGLPELMRTKGFATTPFAVLSRAVAGTRGRSLIVNLPGSPAGAVESMRHIESLAGHVVDLLNGRTAHPAGVLMR